MGTVKPRRILIAGGSGLIGRRLSAALLSQGTEVLVLSRDPRRTETQVRGADVLPWRPGKDGRWQEELEMVDGVVDLAAAPVLTRRRGIAYERDVIGARRAAIVALQDAISRTRRGPGVLVSSSSIAVYGFRRDTEPFTEFTEPDIGPLSKATLGLEQLALGAECRGLRVVHLRTGTVLGGDADALRDLSRALDPIVGRALESRDPWVSWIHVEDAVGLILAALHDRRFRGPLNLTSPGLVGYREFTLKLAGAVGLPAGPPISPRAVQHGLGKAAITVTHGQRVLPVRALERGYTFRYPTIDAALNRLSSRPSLAGQHAGLDKRVSGVTQTRSFGACALAKTEGPDLQGLRDGHGWA